MLPTFLPGAPSNVPSCTDGKRGSVEEPGKPKGVAKAAKENGKADKAAAAVKKERKVYELPGQTRDTPPEVCPEALKPSLAAHPTIQALSNLDKRSSHTNHHTSICQD